MNDLDPVAEWLVYFGVAVTLPVAIALLAAALAGGRKYFALKGKDDDAAYEASVVALVVGMLVWMATLFISLNVLIDHPPHNQSREPAESSTMGTRVGNE